MNGHTDTVHLNFGYALQTRLRTCVSQASCFFTHQLKQRTQQEKQNVEENVYFAHSSNF